MPFTRLALATSISDRLHLLAGQLKTRSRASLTDANHSLEHVMARFFNALLGWNLKNLNDEQANFPAADLGDRELRIAMQITNEGSADKIKRTADKAVEHGLGSSFDQLIVFFLLEKKPGEPRNFVQPVNGPKIECWDLTDLLKQMQSLDTPAPLTAAAKVLDEEMGSSEGRSPHLTLHQLPPRPEGFVGRAADLAKLRAMDPAAGTVLTGLRGMGGIGKTALALVLAHEWAPQFPGAQLFLEGRGTQDNPPGAGDLIAQVIQAFHPTERLPEELPALKSLYHDLLHGKRVLIVLDNARDAAQAAPLIPPAGCGLIVTSRSNFMLGNRPAHSVDRLPADEATALLRGHHAALGDAEAAELVLLCAGLPLALRLAGAHLALDAGERGGAPDVAGYLAKLRASRLGTLDAEAPDAALVSITETLRLCEAKLSEAERAAWRSFGIFTASFDARAAAVIVAAAIAGASYSSIEATLGHLVRRSLLEREDGDRYQMHDLAADYARAQLTESTQAALHLAHARHYTVVGREADGLYLKGDAVGGLALFDRERAQIEAAYAWLAESGDGAAAKQMIAFVDAVVHTGALRFHPRQSIAWQESQLGAARRVHHRAGEGAALGNLGLAHAALGDARRAIEFYEQALAIACEIGDQRGEGGALGNLGRAHADLGDARRAIELYEQQLVIVRKIGDRRGEGNALDCLGLAHASLGDARRAIGFYEQALAIACEIGDQRGEGGALGNLGNAHLDLGDARRAVEFYEQQLVIVRKIGDRQGEGSALGNLGNAHCSLGDPRRAIEFYEQTLVIDREIGDRRGEGAALGNLGSAHSSLGDARRAIDYCEQQRDISREIGDRRSEGIALWNSALAYDSLENRAEAFSRAESALAIFEAIEDTGAARVRARLVKWRGEG